MKGIFKKTKYIVVVILCLIISIYFYRREQFKLADLEIGSFFDVQEVQDEDDDACDE
jgi:hypothetical protein